MAQYQKNFYSSSLYGRLKAFYGEYLTEAFDSQEPFSSRIDARIEAELPSMFYGATSTEFTPADKTKWTVSGTQLKTSTVGTVLDFNATGDDLEVHVLLQKAGAQNIEAKLYKEEVVAGAYHWVEKETKTLNTLSLTQAGTVGKIAFSSFGYADYKVSIKVLDTIGTATVLGAKLQTGHFTLEISASTDKQNWTAWQTVTLTKSLIEGKMFLLTGTSAAAYTNIRYVKGRIGMVSSDNRTSPVIERVELRSEESGLYEANGDYTAKIDMAKVATATGVTFKKVDNIRWSQATPKPGTEIIVRSSSSRDNIFWGPVTAPYRPNTNRVRLKRNKTDHSLTIGPINEPADFQFVKIASMLKWDTEAFLPKDPSNTTISFIFSKTKTDIKNPENILQEITDVLKESNRTITFEPQPYFLTVKLGKTLSGATPVVDMVSVDQQMAYREEVHITNKNISAVDGKGLGLKKLQAINEHSFTYPSGAGRILYNQTQIQNGHQHYVLEDKTNRPADVMLYLKSEETAGFRTNETLFDTDEIHAKVIHRKLENGDTSGIITHYMYGAGEVQYLRPYEREVSSGFTPALSSDKKYRYYVLNGWPAEVHKVIAKQNLAKVAEIYKTTTALITLLNPNMVFNEDGTLLAGQHITLPNNSANKNVALAFKNGTLYTEKSSHNALYDKAKGAVVTDLSSEKIVVNVPVKPASGYVDWLSEEKIYPGVINFDDLRNGFIGSQYNRSANSGFYRDYTVLANDTWETIAAKHEVDVPVLKSVNTSASLTVGQRVVVPPNIILPALAPEAEFEGSNPYHISIVPDSVQKKDGTRVDESFVPIDWNAKRPPMKTTYRTSDVLTAEIKRGSILNGMDPLPLSDVIEVLSVQKKGSSVTYRIWDDTLKAGSFKLTSNYIDWSPAASGSLEPAAGEIYIVTYKRREVDHLEIYLDTTYFEKIGTDIVWRSPEVKVFNGICTPTSDFRMALPAPETFEGFRATYKNVGYVIEDNDLWVETKLENKDGQNDLIGTLNGRDPSKNWHPTIKTGYYYLKEQEHYLYSEPLKTVLDEKVLPTAKNIEYVNGPTGIGALLLPAGTNMVRDSAFQTKDWKQSKVFPNVPKTAAGHWIVEVSKL